MGIGKTKGVGTADADGRFQRARIGRGLGTQGNVLFVCSCATSHRLRRNTFEDLDTVDEMLEVAYSPHEDFKLVFLGLYFSSVTSGRVVGCTASGDRGLVRLGGYEYSELGERVVNLFTSSLFNNGVICPPSGLPG